VTSPADIEVYGMQEFEWPMEFIEAINHAVQRAITKPLREVISSIDDIGANFVSDKAFHENLELLSASILRNKLLAATLSEDDQVRVVLDELIQEMKKSDLFNSDELDFHERVVSGKMRSV
jgi:uncharacterized membrane-anchored protein YjiN (DUF445 family)